jgi:hypothetical protein
MNKQAMIARYKIHRSLAGIAAIWFQELISFTLSEKCIPQPIHNKTSSTTPSSAMAGYSSHRANPDFQASVATHS